MSMTIQSSVKDNILATSSETSKVENAPAEMLCDLDQQMEKRADDEIRESSLIGPKLVQETTDKVVLIKEKLKAARDRQKSYVDNRRKPLEFEVGDRVMLKVSPWKGVIRFGKKGKLAPRYVGPFEILERIGPVAYRLRLPEELSGVHDTFHVSNLKKCLADASLHVPLDEIKVDRTLRFVEEPVEIMDREVKRLKHAAESVRDTIGFEYCLASSSGWTKSPVLWAEIGESSLTGPELVLDTTDKVVLIKEKLKAARDRQKSYADKRRKPLEFEILERIGPVAYRLRLPEELSSVHDTFHVSNLKKCLADANLHVPLNEIKIDKTLRFVEELVEIMDREIRNLKRSKIPLVKVHWNSKRGPEFTWEREDHMKSKYPQLFVDRAVESAS
ncbi:hypothetical protein Tco_0945986 [Tanacetum coccineum]